MNLDKANIPDFGVIVVLGLALLMAIFYRMNELAMSIASGLVGYLGGSVRSTRHDSKNGGDYK